MGQEFYELDLLSVILYFGLTDVHIDLFGNLDNSKNARILCIKGAN